MSGNSAYRDLAPEPLNAKAKLSFFLQFATLFSSGAHITESLLAISKSPEDPHLKEVAESLLRQIGSGLSLSESMTRAGAFSKNEVFLVKLGEETGALSQTLTRIRRNAEIALENQQNMIQVCLYPVLIVLFSVFLTGVLLFLLLPALAPVFRSFGTTLPLPTRLILGLGDLAPWLFLTVTLASLSLLLAKRKLDLKERTRGLLAFVPLIQLRDLAELSVTLATLDSAGARLDTTFGLLSQQARDPRLQESFQSLREMLNEGQTLTDALESQSALPKLWTQLLAVGSETGRLDVMADRLADIYQDEFQWQLGQFATLVEPLFLLFAGGGVGFVLVACLLPLYELVQISL